MKIIHNVIITQLSLPFIKLKFNMLIRSWITVYVVFITLVNCREFEGLVTMIAITYFAYNRCRSKLCLTFHR
jgi:hypothetical protein